MCVSVFVYACVWGVGVGGLKENKIVFFGFCLCLFVLGGVGGGGGPGLKENKKERQKRGLRKAQTREH